MGRIRVTVRDEDRYYMARLTLGQARRHDNFALVSCGLTVGQDGFRRSTLSRWIGQGIAREISKEDYQHSGCQSSCVRRGGQSCHW